MGERNRYQLVDFADGRFVVDARAFPCTVEVARDDVHGDWKTAMVRDFPKAKKGATAELLEVWTNLYGRWARIKIDGRAIDVRPESIRFQSPPTRDGDGGRDE